MRAVGLVRAATAGGYGLLGPRRKPPALLIAMPRVLCLARRRLACWADGRSLTAASVLVAGQHAVSGPSPEGEAWKMKP